MDPQALLKRMSLPLQEMGLGGAAGDARNGGHGQRGARGGGAGEDEERPQSAGAGGWGVGGMVRADASPWVVRASFGERGEGGGGGAEEKKEEGRPSRQPRFLLGVNVQVWGLGV